ncbi:isoprenoid biosynthesis glyoxalase ElbB [bacterium]|nr:isoprenoid biosynthesis glyoxalase ElbB [bacterium]
MAKIGVILAGSGVFDGSEIHEAVLTLLNIVKKGSEYLCIAPDIEQIHTINHAVKDVSEGETRNVLIESARIARGDIKDLKDVSMSEIDGVIFPGGFGAAKNLCDFAVNGANCTINPHVKELILNMYSDGKPIGALCIAPVVIAKAFEGSNVKPVLTIGNDKQTAEAIEMMGGIHTECTPDNIVIDEENKIVSTPAYMLASNIAEFENGIERLVAEVLSMV